MDCSTIVCLEQSEKTGYSFRTKVNAEQSHLTLYFYNERYENTSGMKLTQKHSRAFLPLCIKPLQEKSLGGQIKSAMDALHGVQKPDLFILNIAGNGIARFHKQYNQEQLNLYVYECLCTGLKNFEGKLLLRSGGQTGADWAGLVAGVALAIPVYGYFPKFFLQRDEYLIDKEQNEEHLKKVLLAQSATLKQSVCNAKKLLVHKSIR